MKEKNKKSSFLNNIEQERNNLKTLIEHTPAAIAMFDKEMKYLHVSNRYFDDFGLKPDNIIGKSHYEVFPELPERWKEVHKRCLAGASESCDEDKFIQPNGEVNWSRWQVYPWYETNGEIGGITVFSEIITERKKAEEKIKLSSERLKVALEGAELGAWDWDILSNKTNFNERWAKMLGFELEEIKQNLNLWTDLLHPDDKPMIDEKLNSHLNGSSNIYEAEYRMKHKNGNWVWILDKGKVIERDSAGKALRMAGTHLDITEKKETEEQIKYSQQQLRKLYSNLVSVREDERKAIARELHDEFGQVLTSLNMNLSLLKNNLSKDLLSTEQILNEFDDMQNIISESKVNIKKLIRSLRPAYLDNLGLVPALKNLIEEFSKSSNLKIDFKSNFEEIEMISENENIIYRVVQESLTNVAKHANASKVNIDMRLNDIELDLTIDDDGVGINENDLNKENSYGLLGMRERVFRVGGEIKITNNFGKGTKLQLKMKV